MMRHMLWIPLAVSLACLLIASQSAAAELQIALIWDPPSTNADGTPLTDLAGYRIYLREVPIADDAVPDPAWRIAEVPATQLQAAARYRTLAARGRVYVRATAYDMSGNESSWSNQVEQEYDFLAPGPVLRLRLHYP